MVKIKMKDNVVLTVTRMWANAQRDGHPAKYRWRPLVNASSPQSLADAQYWSAVQ